MASNLQLKFPTYDPTVHERFYFDKIRKIVPNHITFLQDAVDLVKRSTSEMLQVISSLRKIETERNITLRDFNDSAALFNAKVIAREGFNDLMGRVTSLSTFLKEGESIFSNRETQLQAVVDLNIPDEAFTSLIPARLQCVKQALSLIKEWKTEVDSMAKALPDLLLEEKNTMTRVFNRLINNGYTVPMWKKAVSYLYTSTPLITSIQLKKAREETAVDPTSQVAPNSEVAPTSQDVPTQTNSEESKNVNDLHRQAQKTGVLFDSNQEEALHGAKAMSR